MKKFEALDESGSFDFSSNRAPKCPHCGGNFDIRENDAWFLYDENGPHEVECPSCDLEFQVSSIADWYFSTDEQDREDAP